MRCEQFEYEAGSDEDDVQVRPAELAIRPGAMLFRASPAGDAAPGRALLAERADV